MKIAERVVAVSGGFDPIHVGHARMFKEAKKLGDYLVVILNNDKWLRAKKRYVFMPEDERAELISHFPYVDRVIVTSHTENDPDRSVCRILEELRPQVFANGGDRFKEDVPEVEVCKRLNIEMVFNIGGGKIQSSSWMIDRVTDEIRTFHRPWGFYRNHQTLEGIHLKTLHITPGKRLSLQRHRQRSEMWFLVEGDAKAVIGNDMENLKTIHLSHHVPIFVPVNTIHRLWSDGGGVIVEISTGKYDENDIERLDDDYGRALQNIIAQFT